MFVSALENIQPLDVFYKELQNWNNFIYIFLIQNKLSTLKNSEISNQRPDLSFLLSNRMVLQPQAPEIWTVTVPWGCCPHHPLMVTSSPFQAYKCQQLPLGKCLLPTRNSFKWKWTALLKYNYYSPVLVINNLDFKHRYCFQCIYKLEKENYLQLLFLHSVLFCFPLWIWKLLIFQGSIVLWVCASGSSLSSNPVSTHDTWSSECIPLPP